MIYVLYWLVSGAVIWLVKIFLFFRGPSNYMDWMCEFQQCKNELDKAKMKLFVNNHKTIFYIISLLYGIAYGPLMLLDIHVTNKQINEIINKNNKYPGIDN